MMIDFWIRPKKGMGFSSGRNIWLSLHGLTIGSISASRGPAIYYRDVSPVELNDIKNRETFIRLLKPKGTDALSVYANGELIKTIRPYGGKTFASIKYFNYLGVPKYITDTRPNSVKWFNVIAPTDLMKICFDMAEARMFLDGDNYPTTEIPTTGISIGG